MLEVLISHTNDQIKGHQWLIKNKLKGPWRYSSSAAIENGFYSHMSHVFIWELGSCTTRRLINRYHILDICPLRLMSYRGIILTFDLILFETIYITGKMLYNYLLIWVDVSDKEVVYSRVGLFIWQGKEMVS